MIEVDAVIRIPIDFEVISARVLAKLQLTPREAQALDGILHGLQNKEIADVMHTSERTVKAHVSAVLEKFKVRSRHDLRGILTPAGNGNSVMRGKETTACR